MEEITLGADADKPQPIRLNLGAGAVPLEGYINLDRKTGEECYPLARPDNSADEIRASHILEHFPFRTTFNVLADWVRVLKPGGLLKLAVPDFDWQHTVYASDQASQYPLESYLMGGQTDKDDFHFAMFNAAKLTQLMEMAGVGEIERWKSTDPDCSSLPVSLNLQGRKGARKFPSLKGKVEGIYSMPRLAFTDNMFGATTTALALEINFTRRSGAFWGHSMQSVMEMFVDKVPYLLAVDYDTVFHFTDVLSLYRAMESNPQVDALNAVQIGRDRQTILMTIAGENGKPKTFIAPEDAEKDLMPVLSAHFGLTMIRTESLKKLPKPWFHSEPDKDGSWGQGRIDDDVYFWRKWRETGLNLMQANRIPVGHIQQVITWPSQHLDPVHQYLPDYQNHGKPAGVWR